MENSAIPTFLNQPPRWSFFEKSDVYLFMNVLALFFLIDFMVIGLLVGVMAVKLKKRLQKSEVGDLTKLGMYWLLPHSISSSFFNVIPPCYIREFVG
jgi:type IV conjugative transfer system protein TraL